LKKLILAAIAACILISNYLLAEDVNSFLLVGNVIRVDIESINNVYLQTKIALDDRDPYPQPKPLILTCNGNGSGMLPNCLYPSAFLNCPTNSYTTTEGPKVITHFYCTSSRGECTTFAGKMIIDELSRTSNSQILTLQVEDITWSSNCSSK